VGQRRAAKPSQLSFELGEGLRLRHTRFKFIALFDGPEKEREPVVAGLTRIGGHWSAA